MKSFIDDNDKIENDRTFYQKFENVTSSIDDVFKEKYDKSIVDIQKIDVSTFCETSKEEIEIDKSKDTEKRIEKFKETLFPVSTENDDDDDDDDDDDENNYNSFVNAIFFAITFYVEQKADLCRLAQSRKV